jgi:S1-C subfamily serine protease
MKKSFHTLKMHFLTYLLGGLISFFVMSFVPFSYASAKNADSDPNGPRVGVAPSVAIDSANRVEDAVVKVFATVRYPDPFKPWMKQAPQEVTGSGVIIEGRRILTNAHIVLYASQLQVQANQDSDKVSATVEAIAPGIDLAVLKLEDERVFDTRPPLERANTLPEIKDAVMAYGFPTGGISLSITKGIVSRIEFTNYNYPVSGLRIQIDAAINPGNSGGPAVSGSKMIGLVFSILGGSQNISYIIPCEEIEMFLQDIADGRYDGKPMMLDEFQTFENPALRSFLKLDKTVEGIIVNRPFRTDNVYPLKKWDIITRIGNEQIDNQGMIKLDANLRIRFQYFIQKFAKNGKILLTVVRAAKEATVEVPVFFSRPMLIPYLQGTYPSYFIYGPVVFSSATAQFLSALNSAKRNLLGALSLTASPLVTRRGGMPAFDGEELVVVSSPFFPHRLARGYSNPVAEVVKTVNDVPIKNLAHLVEVLRDSRDELIIFGFNRSGSEILVFPRKEMLAATEEILTDNDIRTQGSQDILEVWNTKPFQ